MCHVERFPGPNHSIKQGGRRPIRLDRNFEWIFISKGNPLRVLIADADDIFLELAQCYLGDRGYEVEIAGNSMECFAIQREFRPDILVLGKCMFRGGPEGMLARLAESSLSKHLPVLLIIDSESDSSLFSLGNIADTLMKPFRLHDLHFKIATIQQQVASH